MASPKVRSSVNQSRFNMVPGCRSGKENNNNKKNTTQQDDSAEVLKPINKGLQRKSTIFSEKLKKSEDDIFGDMVVPELKGLSCSILKVKFKHEVNNLIFKYEMFNSQ